MTEFRFREFKCDELIKSGDVLTQSEIDILGNINISIKNIRKLNSPSAVIYGLNYTGQGLFGINITPFTFSVDEFLISENFNMFKYCDFCYIFNLENTVKNGTIRLVGVTTDYEKCTKMYFRKKKLERIVDETQLFL